MSIPPPSLCCTADGLVEGTGHFHVLIDQKATAVGEALPFDDT